MRKMPFNIGPELGVWIWGFVSSVIAGVILYYICKGTDTQIKRIEQTSTVLAAIVAAGALAWSLFYQVGSANSSNEKLTSIEEQLSKLTTEIQELRKKQMSSADASTGEPPDQ
jgi:hypothetical protein